MSGAVLQSLGWALLHLLWQGALVAAVLALALMGVGRRSASARYLLACGALALMLVLPAVTGWYHYTTPRAEPRSEAPAALVAPETAPALAVAPLAEALAPRAPAPQPTPSVEWTLALLGEHMHWLVLAWALGVAMSSLRLLTGWLRLRRLVHEAEPAPAEWQETLGRLARRLGMTRTVRLLRSAALDVPATVGWLRPVVLLPVSALTGLTPRQLELVLAHELAHIRRHDFAVNLVQTLVETLLFYHPAVWWMSHIIRVERENCCDDIAVGTGGNAVSYARALTALEALRMQPLGSAAMSALGGSLTERVRRLVGAPAARCSSRWVAGASVLTLVSGMAVAAPLATLVLPESTPEPVPVLAPAPVLALAQVPPVTVPVPVPTPDATPAASPGKDKSKHKNKNKHKDPNPNPNPDPDPDWDEDEDTTRVDAQKLSVDQLIALKVAGVSPERVKQVEALGYEPTVGNLVQFGHANVTPEYVKELTAVLGRKPTADELVQMRHLGVTAERVKALKAAGYSNPSADELAQAAALGIDERFINDMKSAGYTNVPFDDLIQLRALGVDGKFVAAMKSAGYANLPADDLAQLKALGVSPDFLRKLRDAGLEKLSVDELIRLRASGIDADYIRELRKK